MRCFCGLAKSEEPRESCYLRLLRETHASYLSAQEHREGTLIRDFVAAKLNAMKKQRALQAISDHMVLCETPLRPLGGLLGAQEHREETLICDVGVVKFEAVKYQRTP